MVDVTTESFVVITIMCGAVFTDDLISATIIDRIAVHWVGVRVGSSVNAGTCLGVVDL